MSKQCQVLFFFFNYCVQVICGNEFTIGVPHSASVFCNSCTKSSIVSIAVWFSCISHCLTAMKPHLSILHLHSLLCVKDLHTNCYVLLVHIVFTD